MAVPAQQKPGAAAVEPRAFRRLLPDGQPATAAEIVEELGLPARAGPRRPHGHPPPAAEIAEELGLPERAATPRERPYLLLNMVSTVDGRATVGGRAGPLGGRAHRRLVPR